MNRFDCQIPEEVLSMSVEDRQVWIGREMLKTMREMFDDAGLALRLGFDAFVEGAPLTPTMKAAIAAARKADAR